MSHTNSTANYGLPQFITTDKPFWLTDINQAFSDIDLAIKNASDTATTASNNATQALSDASAASTAATAADTKATGAGASIADTFDATSTYSIGACVMYNSLLYRCTAAITTPGPWTGSANWTRVNAEDLIDLKQNINDNALTTTNKTIVGAINEVKDEADNIVSRLGGFNVNSRVIEPNSAVQSPGYTSFCIAIVGRADSAMFVGSWSDVQAIKTASGIGASYLASPNRLQITNTSGSAHVVVFLYV